MPKTTLINNGIKTEWSPTRPAIIRVINKTGQPRSGSPICQYLLVSELDDTMSCYHLYITITISHKVLKVSFEEELLQSQSIELLTMVIVINVVTDGFSRGLKMIGSCNCPIAGVQLRLTVLLQLCRLIRAKYSSYAPITFKEISIVNRRNCMREKNPFGNKSWTENRKKIKI